VQASACFSTVTLQVQNPLNCDDLLNTPNIRFENQQCAGRLCYLFLYYLTVIHSKEKITGETFHPPSSLRDLSKRNPSTARNFSPTALSSSRQHSAQCRRPLGCSPLPVFEFDFVEDFRLTSSGKNVMFQCGSSDWRMRSCMYTVPGSLYERASEK
jgi:hypothetical protein